MRLHVYRRISGRWHALVSYRGRVIETYSFSRKYAIQEAVLHAYIEVLN